MEAYDKAFLHELQADFPEYQFKFTVHPCTFHPWYGTVKFEGRIIGSCDTTFEHVQQHARVCAEQHRRRNHAFRLCPDR